MPRRAKKRQADEIVRASFSIPYGKWQQFQEVVRAQGSTVSATLFSLIEEYLITQRSSPSSVENPGNKLEENEDLVTEIDYLKDKFSQLQRKIKALETNLDNRMEAAVASQLNSLDHRLSSLQTKVTELNQRQSKFENNPKQADKSYFYSEDNLIDVEAIPVEEEIDNGKSKASESDLFDDIFEVLENFQYQETEITDQGITEQALCRRFGLKPSRIIRNAKLRGLSSPEYLYQVTGWFYHNGKYYSSSSLGN